MFEPVTCKIRDQDDKPPTTYDPLVLSKNHYIPLDQSNPQTYLHITLPISTHTLSHRSKGRRSSLFHRRSSQGLIKQAMEMSNWRPAEGASSNAGGSSMELGDWRDQLQADSRQRIVGKIMDTLRRHLPFSGEEGLQELNKIAMRFEDKIHTAATSQSDYLRKISLKMLTMETRSQNLMPDAIQPNSVVNTVNPSYPDVTNSITVKSARLKKIWTRVQDEKLVDALMELHASRKYKYGADNGFKPGYFQAVQKLLDISLPNSGLKETHIKSRLKKLKSNFCIVHEMLVDTDVSGFGWDPIKCCVIADDQAWNAYLQTHKNAFHFKDKSFPFYEKLSVIFGKDRATASRDVGLVDDDEVVGETQESSPIDRKETDIDLGVQLTRDITGGTSSKRKRGKGILLDSTVGNPNGEDWQEEVYQKIRAMKDLYLLDLNDMHQRLVAKLHQRESVPEQPKNEQIEKLRIFKNMLERFIQFLQIPKHGILANYSDKLATYERQIVNAISTNRRKPAPTQH